MADKVAMAGPASPLLVPWWAGLMIYTVFELVGRRTDAVCGLDALGTLGRRGRRA